MKVTREEAQASKVPALSMEECLQNFDDSLMQCQEYYRMKAQREQEEQLMSTNFSLQFTNQIGANSNKARSQ